MLKQKVKLIHKMKNERLFLENLSNPEEVLYKYYVTLHHITTGDS